MLNTNDMKDSKIGRQFYDVSNSNRIHLNFHEKMIFTQVIFKVNWFHSKLRKQGNM